jgi:hypothetical protein
MIIVKHLFKNYKRQEVEILSLHQGQANLGYFLGVVSISPAAPNTVFLL